MVGLYFPMHKLWLARDMSLPPEQPHERRSPSGEMNYKGVRQRKSGSWVSEVRLPNSRERIWLGSYYTPEKAARAFDAASLCLHGPGGADGLNFPSSPPAVRRRTSDRKEVLAAALSHANQSTATESPSANGGAPMERVPTLPPASRRCPGPEAESTDWSQLLPPMPSPIRMGSHTYLPVSPTAAAAEDVDMEEEDSGSCYGLWSPSFC